MHTISIEQINLNGIPMTSDNGKLYFNDQLISSEQIIIDEHTFAKGYVPISFFSSMPISGSKLTEVFFGSKFIATGWMIHSTYPDLANGAVNGRFYYRYPDSVTKTYQVSNFTMNQGNITQSAEAAFNTIVPSDAVLGIDVFNYPSRIRDLSINLLGFFPGAGAFDRIPKDYSFYIKYPETGLEVDEAFVQHATTLTGLNIYCSHSGTAPVSPSNYPLSGQIYKVDNAEVKINCQDFTFNSGIYKSSDIPINIQLGAKDRIGIDINYTLSGIQGLMISAHGYLN